MAVPHIGDPRAPHDVEVDAEDVQARPPEAKALGPFSDPLKV